MKYSLTIHNLTASQVTEIVNRIENETVITTNRENVIAGNFQLPIGSPAAVAAVTEAANQNAHAAGASANDVDSILNASTNQLLQADKTGELDSAGLPWDERIHSGSKKKNADGKWKLRKNVDEALVKSVEAENRGAGGQLPAFLQNKPAPAQPAAPATVPPTVPAISVANATAPVAPPAPASPIMAQPQAPLARDFSGLMLKISNLFATKQITPDYPNTIVARINAGFQIDSVKTLTDVANDPRMVEYAWQCLEVDGKAA